MADVETNNKMMEGIVSCCETLDGITGIFETIMKTSRESETYELYETAIRMYDEIIAKMQVLRDKYPRGEESEVQGVLLDSQSTEALTPSEEKELFSIFTNWLNEAIICRNKATNQYKLQREKSPYAAFSQGDFVSKLMELKVCILLDAFFSCISGPGSVMLFYDSIKHLFTPGVSGLAAVGYMYAILCSVTVGIVGYTEFESFLKGCSEHREVSKIQKFFKGGKRGLPNSR